MCKDRQWKKPVSICIAEVMALILGMMLLLSANVSAQASSEAGTEPLNRDGAVSYLEKGEAASSEWTPLCLAVAGTAPSSSQVQQVEDAIAQGTEVSLNPTDLAKQILLASACGLDPADVSGVDLLEALSKQEQMDRQGANGPLFALLALDCKGYQLPEGSSWSRENLTELLLSYQREDGGFCLNDQLEPDVDVTALSLLALAPYREDAQVARSVELGLTWLSGQQLDNGGFASMGQESCESVSSVLSALAALGISPEDPDFVKGGRSPLDALAVFQQQDGGFSHLPDGPSNILATQQALLAIVGTEEKVSPYRLDLLPEPEPARSPAAVVVSFLLMTLGTFALIYLSLVLIKRMGDRRYERQRGTLGGADAIDTTSQQRKTERVDADEPGYRQPGPGEEQGREETE